MSVADRPAVEVSVTKQTGPPHFDLAAGVFVLAVAVITIHIADALLQQGPALLALLSLSAGLLATLLFLRSGAITRGILAMLIGVVAAIESTGIAVAHTIKGAATRADTTGLASGVAATALVVLGAVLILRRVGGWRRWLAVPVVLAVAVYVVAPLSMAVNVTHSSPGGLSGKTPADAGLEFREVSVQTRDGVQLSGWYIPSRNRAAVMMIAGGGGTRDGVLDHSIVLAQHGYGVLDLDPRGHGLSQGAPMDLGWYGKLDVDAGVTFLTEQPDVDPPRIAVLGTSMGGEEALTTAAVDPRIAAVVNEGGWCRVFDDLAPVLEHDPSQYGLLPYYWTFPSSAKLMTSAQPPVPLARAMDELGPRPVLLISASEEPEMTVMSHLQSRAPQSSALWIAPNTPHTQALYVHPDEWQARVLNFLDHVVLSNATVP